MKELYYNGYIITMNGGKVANGVLVSDGKVEVVGNFNNIDDIPDAAVKKIDLKGKVMMPSFIDAHSHITAVARTMSLADLNGVTSTDEIIERLEKFKKERNFGDKEWIIGFGYDNNNFEGKKRPQESELDVFVNPVLITHKSGHMGVFNTAAMKELNITNADKGYLEEDAFITASGRVPKPSFKEMQAALKQAEKMYLSYGITTIQDGLSNIGDVELLSKTPLDADVVSYIDYKAKDEILDKYSEYLGKYKGNYKIGGYKIILDGSPQAKTAWLSKPYNGEETFRGTPYYTDDKVEEIMKDAVTHNVQVLAHCNGDMASEQFIKAYYHAINELKVDMKTRPVMIHAQTLRDDQIRRMANLDIIPSFFVSHIYHFGDIHYVNLGVSRAKKISPIRTAIDFGLKFTLHQDSPVLPPDMMDLIYSAVNRITKNGIHLGTFEKVESYEALEGITINAAYQYFEENTKGSIEEGKYADFVILDGNPYECDKEKLRDIKVLATIKRGKVLYKADSETN